jgi:ABC-type Na+ efflux pump permease subunit
MKNMVFNAIILIVIIVLAVLVSFGQWRQGLVISGQDATYRIGEEFDADLIIGLDSGDSISANDHVLVTISKDGIVVEAKVITFKEFIELSDKQIVPVSRSLGEYYETPGTYIVHLNQVIRYVFEEQGKYDVNLLILRENIDVTQTFNVAE